MHRLIVHIGLSKTGTSSLQIDYFNKYNKRYWNYIGVYQPRSEAQHNIYKKLMKWTIYKQDGDLAKKTITNEIENKLKTEINPLVISEEMLTVSSNGVEWQDKLKRLEEVISGFDYLIIVTVRKPIDALFSYYVERFNALSTRFPTFISFFKHSNEANLYRYDYLHKFLISVFEEPCIAYVPFESIYQNHFTNLVSEAMQMDGPFKDGQLPNRNMRRRTAKGVYVPSHQQDKWIGDVPERRSPRATLRNLLGRIKKFMSSPSKNSLVPYLTEDEKKFCAQRLAERNQAFKQASGIDYMKPTGSVNDTTN